jgi:hypothetical protein
MEKTGIAKISRAATSMGATQSPASQRATMRARQIQRIKEIRQALIEAGFVSLEKQSEALALSRSSTWAVLRANHKGSGLTAAVVARMLTSSRLPPQARIVIVQYVKEKLQGAYGHSKRQQANFGARLQRHGSESSRIKPF